eukprot:2377749-Pyramimonas_sp.AAC.1
MGAAKYHQKKSQKRTGARLAEEGEKTHRSKYESAMQCVETVKSAANSTAEWKWLKENLTNLAKADELVKLAQGAVAPPVARSMTEGPKEVRQGGNADQRI